jgi:hypothetical protein
LSLQLVAKEQRPEAFVTTTAIKDFLARILDRVELDPELAILQVCYRIPLRGGNSVASPRGFEPLLPP